MIQEFVKIWDEKKDVLREKFSAAHPSSYTEIVRSVVELLKSEEDYGGAPDPELITTIDHGEYQGTLVYVIGEGGYQPHHYWAVKVGYGSCSGCDTLESIREYSDDPPTEAQVNDYMTLALHIVQGLKEI